MALQEAYDHLGSIIESLPEISRGDDEIISRRITRAAEALVDAASTLLEGNKGTAYELMDEAQNNMRTTQLSPQ